MATRKAKKSGAKKGVKAQSQNVEVPTLMGAIEGLNRQTGGGSAAPAPRRRKVPGITPKFRKLR